MAANSARGAFALTGDSSLAVAATWPRYVRTLTQVARRMTRDADEQADLLQEALVELWKTDPTRFDLRDPREVRYLKRILVSRMWRVWGAEGGRFTRKAEELGGELAAHHRRR